MESHDGSKGRCWTAKPRLLAVDEKALLRRNVRLLDRPTGVAPRAEAAADMGDGLQTHALRRLGGERRARTAGAEEHEFPVRRKGRLVILAGRVEPEFQHAAWAMERAGNAPLTVELSD